MDTLMPVTVNKVPNVAIDVSDLILTDCGEAPVRVMIQWHENVDPRFNDDTSESSEFHYGIRMYAPNLILSNITITEETWSAESSKTEGVRAETY